MTAPHYFVPRGGLPAQDELTTDRAHVLRGRSGPMSG